MRLSQDREIPKPVLYGVLAAAVIGAVVYVSWSVTGGSSSGSLEVHYPYWCDQCKAVYDVEELKKDPPNTWRMVPGKSDSVVLCIKCNKGHAYPAVPCPKCGTYHLLHVLPDMRCPKCFPEAAKAAEAAGVNLTPPELPK